MNIFEQATRQNLTFDSPKGQLIVQDLWNLPLQSTTGKPNLDDIAIALDAKLKASATRVSFIAPEKSSLAQADVLRLEVVKHIINVKVAERDAASAARERNEKAQHIMALIAKKEQEALEGTSMEDLKAQLADLIK